MNAEDDIYLYREPDMDDIRYVIFSLIVTMLWVWIDYAVNFTNLIGTLVALIY